MASCLKCDAALTADDLFCPDCGHKVIKQKAHSSKHKVLLSKTPHQKKSRETTVVTDSNSSSDVVHQQTSATEKLGHAVLYTSLIIVGVIFLIAGYAGYAILLILTAALTFCIFRVKPKHHKHHFDHVNPIPQREHGEIVKGEAKDYEALQVKGSHQSRQEPQRDAGYGEESEEIPEMNIADTTDTLMGPVLIALLPLLFLTVFVVVVWPLTAWATVFSIIVVLFTAILGVILVRDVMRQERDYLRREDKGKDISTEILVSIGFMVLLTLILSIVDMVLAGSVELTGKLFFMSYLFLLLTFVGIVSTVSFNAILTRRRFEIMRRAREKKSVMEN